MRLRSGKGLMVAYLEGLSVVGLWFLAATYMQIDFDFYGIIASALILPISFIVLDAILKSYPISVSLTAGNMGGWTAFVIEKKVIGMGWAILVGFLFLLLVWFCFDEINKIYFIKKP